MAPVAHIVGGGLATGAAPTLEGTREALSGRRTTFLRAEGFVGEDFRPQLCALRDPRIGATLEERLTALAVEATDDLVAHAGGWDGAPVPLALCLPEARDEEGTAAVTEAVADRIAEAAAARVEAAGGRIGRVLALPHGPTAPVEALLALGGDAPGAGAVLLSVDSYGCRRRLGVLLRQGRLFSRAGPWGLVPGEAGVAFRLAWRAAHDPSLGPALLGPTVGTEPDGEMDDRDSAFGALSDCLQGAAAALAEAGALPVGAISTGWNNARYRASEFSYALHRLPPGTAAADAPTLHPAMRFGETGAATIPLATILAALESPGPALHCAGTTWRRSRAAWAFR